MEYKQYTDGKRIISATPVAFNAIYKAQGFKEVEKIFENQPVIILNGGTLSENAENKGGEENERLNKGRSNRKDKNHDTSVDAGKSDK